MTSDGSHEACITVRNAGPLRGEVVVPGAKNAVLKLMAASLMADGAYELTNVPAIADVAIMADLLSAIGVHVSLPERGIVSIVNDGDLTPVAPYELVERIRKRFKLSVHPRSVQRALEREKRGS